MDGRRTTGGGSSSLTSSREAMDIICEMSDLLDVGLDRSALLALVDLLDAGIHPEALAAAVTELRREAVAAASGGQNAH